MAAVRRALAGPGIAAGQGLVVGVSGGADSVALLDAVATLAPGRGLRVVAAHLDHGLREDSADDARFVADLCARRGVPLRSGRADVRARARRDGRGLEAAARAERHAFLSRVRREERAALVLLAHTRDDQAETVLLRLLRGAGSRGLGAMRVRAGRLLRPLLGVSRAEVLAHVEARGLRFREDASNSDPAFARNRVRHELLPYLEARFNPRLREGLARTAALLADEADCLERLAARIPIEQPSADQAEVPLAVLREAQPALARLLLRRAIGHTGGLARVTADQVERLLALARRPGRSGRRLPLPGGREASLRFDRLHLGPRSAAPGAFERPLPVPGEVALPAGTLRAEPASGPAISNAEMAILPLPEEPLVVRTRRPGDRVRSGGREISLGRFLMSRRVPAEARAGLALVAAGRRVLFVPGLELDAPRAEGAHVRLAWQRAPAAALREIA
ncbi:MAG: tRNA lysidine(34) synthetase TilS [Vicinamibacteria bacterium]